jgi:large subunit ribosomal protein L23
MITLQDVVKRPLVTEKSERNREATHAFAFEVHRDATKIQVKQAVEKLFKVKVAGVRTSNLDGKMRRRGRFVGYKRDWKKAYVKLKDGEKVPDFAQI